MCFIGVLRGEHAHCKNNGRGFFNRERILHCKPVNAPYTLIHVRELLHLRHSLDSNTALGFTSCTVSHAIIHIQYSLTNTVAVNKKLTYRNSIYGVITLQYVTVGIPHITLYTDVVHEIGCQL